MLRYLMIILCVFCFGAKASHAYRHLHQAAESSKPNTALMTVR